MNNLPNLHPYICPQCHKSHGVTGIYTPQESKYCQSCSDSWETKPVKLSELNIGDRVKIKYIKFKENDPNCSYGYLTRLANKHNFFKAIINGMEIEIHGDWFLAKMEPITYVAEWKERLIQK